MEHGVWKRSVQSVIKTRSCPWCGNQDWQWPDLTVGLPLVVGHHTTIDSGINVTPVICETCGYVRFHSRDTF